MKINVNNINLYYQKFGSGEQTIIFLHGNNEDSSLFKDIPNCLHEYTIYLVDSRCHGQSDNSKQLHYDDMADDIIDFIEKLAIKKPILFGFSDGGIIGLLLAIKKPNLLSQLIVAGANLNPKGIKPLWRHLIRFCHLFTRDKKLKLMLKEPNIRRMDLHKIKIHTLVIAGSKDLVHRSHLKDYTQILPFSKLVILEKETHSSYIKDNKKLAKIIKEFI